METIEILTRLEKVREARMEIGVEIALYRDFLRWLAYEGDFGPASERARTLIEGIRRIEGGR